MRLCIWHRALLIYPTRNFLYWPLAISTSRESTEKYSTSACGTLSGSSHVELLEGDTASYSFTIFRTLHYNALHSVVQILLHDEAQGTTPMHFYKCFPLRGQVSPIQAVSMGGSPARGLAILLDIHSQEIHFQENHFQGTHYQETNFKEKSALVEEVLPED